MIAARIRELLEPAYEVVGVVASGEDLESAFEALAPEVVVADIVMPGKGGLAAVRHDPGPASRHPGRLPQRDRRPLDDPDEPFERRLGVRGEG